MTAKPPRLTAEHLSAGETGSEVPAQESASGV